jgi:sec-independent protein translocase protein TatA
MHILGIVGAPEIVVILLVVLVLFGGRKIPELMKGLGKGVKEYKKAVNGIEDEVNEAVKEDSGKQKEVKKESGE